MSVALHCSLVAADTAAVLWEGMASGGPGKQQEFKFSKPVADVPAETRAVFRTADGASATIAPVVAASEAGNDKTWARSGKLGDALVTQVLLKKQASGLWKIKKLVVTTPAGPAPDTAAPVRPPRITCPDEEAGDEMLMCARYGEFEDMVAILDAGVVPVDYQNDGLNTALHYVSANGNLECVQELLRRGARSLGNSSGNTPLHWAVLNKHLEVTVELLTNLPGCDVLRKNDFGRSSLTEAFQTNDEKILEVVLGHSSAAALENPAASGVQEEETEEQVEEGPEAGSQGEAADAMEVE